MEHILQITKGTKRDAKNLKDLAKIKHNSASEAVANNEICKDHGLPLTLHCNNIEKQQFLCITCALSGSRGVSHDVTEVSDKVRDIKAQVAKIKEEITETQAAIYKVGPF